ncbi:acyl-CoA dehydrogenase family protein [Algihabitans albus]|uniref:acyl-CoA dehydrogenase family protein n=1 Tax=Algihabitans albus TaxID=2164067 RepID=UPI000E5D353C|nr:acyl-CoA dehydrogenase [Algihabitans albus]
MRFTLSQEQALLRDTVARLVRERFGFEARLKTLESAAGFDRDVWREFAEIGLLGAPFGEEVGGFGGGGVELMTVMRELGRGLLLEPYLASVVLAGSLIERLGTPEQCSDYLRPMIAGEALLAFAHGEPDSRYALEQVATRAVATSGGWRLDGRKSVVLHGGEANTLVVSARTAGAQDDEKGIGLFLLPCDAMGLSLHPYPTIDGLRAAELELDGVVIPAEAALGEPGTAYSAIEAAVARGLVALCGEAVGAMETCCDMTLDYLKQRKQFGVTIGSFQVLQHRMVDLRGLLEQARSMAILAAGRLDGERAERERAVSAAKNLIGRAGRTIAEESIQLHGGIGMTWEYALPHFAKRLVMIDHLLGDEDHHLDRFVMLERAASAAPPLSAVN